MLVVYLSLTNRLEEAKSKINDQRMNPCPLTSVPKACLHSSVCDLNEMFLFYGLCQKILCASLVFKPLLA